MDVAPITHTALEWETTVTDANGNKRTYVSRGPRYKFEVEESIQHILDTQRRRAITSGNPDPMLKIVDCKLKGNDSPLGSVAPRRAKAVNLDQYVKQEVLED